MAFRSAAELSNDSALMRPPTVLVEPCAVTGYVSLLTLGPKGGKSTTVAAMMAEGSRRGVRSGLVSLDEALSDSLQRLLRFDAVPDHVFLDATWEPTMLAEQCDRLQIKLLVVDHLGKLAEMNQDFGANSQGDAVLWGRLVSPFNELARSMQIAVVLLDQARRSDGHWTGSVGKGGSVDIICEMNAKRGALHCTPRGRIQLPAFRAALDVHGRPAFTHVASSDGGSSSRKSEEKMRITDAVRDAITQKPGRPSRRLREEIAASPKALQAALKMLEADGLIENRKRGNRDAWFPCPLDHDARAAE